MLKIVKRSAVSKREQLLIRVAAILLAFGLTSVFVLIVKKNPFQLFISMFDGAFGSSYRIKETIVEATPLLITALAVTIAFKMKFWNIGAEGQIAMGAFAATYFAITFGDIPQPLLLTVMIIAAFIGGALWASIPAILKAYFKTNETILTLMLNYIALLWILYLQHGPWRDPDANGMPQIVKFSDNAILPELFGIHIGWIFAILLTVFVFYFLNHTKKGYEIAVIGESENTASYAGINIKKVMITAMMLSGGIAGITGFIQTAGLNKTLNKGITGGYGFSAIIVAWLAGLNPVVAALIAILFAAMVQGGDFIQTTMQVSKNIADIMQGLMLFCILGSEFFIRYKLVKSEEVIK